MENTPTITIPRGEAKKIYQNYAEVVKGRKEQYLQELKKTYYHLSKGHKVLDIFEVFKKSGVNKSGEPKLAICVASKKTVFFQKQSWGAGHFSEKDEREAGIKADIRLPSNTFSDWKTEKGGWDKKQDIPIRQNITTKVPIVPAHLLPPGKLNNYYILWEVSDWKEIPEYKDPFLLMRINANAFVVLAEWDLTKVEQAIIRGR